MTFSDAFATVTADMLRELGVTNPATINQGNCDEWANRMQALVGGREARWLDSMIDVDEFPIDAQPRIGHCVLIFNGRYYDSEHPEGVSHVLILAGFEEEDALMFDGWVCRE